MDPATVAGLVLGIIPLIISVVENYEVTFQPFITYRHYSSELSKFATKLNTQKAIFNNQCQILLQATKADDSEVALDRILKERRHALRQKGPLSNHLEALLGTSLETCVSLMQLVKVTLDEILEETKGFQALSNKKPGEKTGFSHIRSRIKLSFSKTRLNNKIDELRHYNDDLISLSTQLSAVKLQKSTRKTALPTIIFELKTARQASETLYSLLVSKWVCGDQIDHAASLSLDVKMQQRPQVAATEFLLSMDCIFRPPTTTKKSSTVWLKVDSKSRAEEEADGKLGSTLDDDATVLVNAMKQFKIMPEPLPLLPSCDKPGNWLRTDYSST